MDERLYWSRVAIGYRVVTRELHNAMPREQAGAQTGPCYEYQYEQGAAESLLVLDDTKVGYVYFEWHDDYVTERADGDYEFNQVKTRGRSEGPWTVGTFFGTGKHVATSPFARMFEHTEKFGERCALLLFVSNVGVRSDLSALVDACHGATKVEELPQDVLKTFRSQAKKLAKLPGQPGEAALFDFLKKLRFKDGLGERGDSKGNRTLIGGRIDDYSEVELTFPECRRIADELIGLVRERSHVVLSKVPATQEALRLQKGLGLDDVLQVLSLSPEGYRTLQLCGREGVLSLSRLHRLCRRSEIPEDLIPELCRIKSDWDQWWRREKSLVSRLDYLVLRKDCGEALRGQVGKKDAFLMLKKESHRLATHFATSFSSSTPLTADLVFGLMLSVAAEAES